MNEHSTTIQKITISTGAGIIAAAAIGAVPVNGMASEAANTAQAVSMKSATVLRSQGDFGLGVGHVAGAKVSYPIAEKWDKAKHKDELRKLIAKKASHPSSFTAQDARRLATLQQMRRETLPQAMSYDEFVREQDRKEALLKLTEDLMAYERKFGAVANG